MSYAGGEFNLNDIQSGWVVSSPSFAAMIAMLFSGKLSDKLGRRRILIYVAFLYAVSALLSAFASSYEMLYIARMIGGLAFGAALVLAPMYIAEIAPANKRGNLVTYYQLAIVIGFFVVFLVTYFIGNNLTEKDIHWLVAHQANKRIIQATANRVGVSADKVMMNIHKYGNTTSATLPLLLADYEDQLKKGDNLIFAAFGGGFTWGSIYLKWAYNTKN